MLSKKGFNQVDMAVALGLMMMMLTFVVIYTNSIITPHLASTQSAEIRTTAKSLGDIIFEDRGVPSDWPYKPEAVRPSLMEYIYYTPVIINEINNTFRDDVVVSVNVTVDEHAWNDSIKAYDGNISLETDLEAQGDADNDGLLTWMNVSFRVDIPAKANKVIRIYYSSDNTTDVTYTALSITSATTYNVTVFGEERLKGLTPLKLNKIHNTGVDYLAPRYGTDRSFRIEVENVTGSKYVAGDSLPTTATVTVNERRLPSQNKTGFINSARATVWVW